MDRILNRRGFLKGALGAGAALALSGCGRKTSSGKVKITYNTHWAGLDTHTSVMHWMYKEFRARHPEIEFEVAEMAGNKMDNGKKLMAELAAGAGPDVLHDITYDHVRAGYALDLTDLVKPWEDRFYPEALEACRWGGPLYGVPTECCPEACFWNMNVLRKVDSQIPSTMDEFMALGKALKKKGIALTCTMAAGFTAFPVMLFCFPNAKEVIAAEDWYSEPFLRTTEGWKEIIDSGFFPRNDSEVQRGSAENMFRTGAIACMMGGAWMLRNRITAEGVDPEFRNQVQFTPFPAFNGVRPIRKWVATRTALNQKLRYDRRKRDAALSFLEFFTSKESAVKFVSEAQSPLGVKLNITEQMAGPLLHRFLKAQDLATGTFVVPNNPGIFDQKFFFPGIIDLFASLMEGASPKHALKVFAEDMRT